MGDWPGDDVEVVRKGTGGPIATVLAVEAEEGCAYPLAARLLACAVPARRVDSERRPEFIADVPIPEFSGVDDVRKPGIVCAGQSTGDIGDDGRRETCSVYF